MSLTPIVKKPKNPVAFPPPHALRAYQVRDGDNWWVLQKQFGLRDPWTLIKYNFATSDPAEVNWYLREYVGCTKTTADGKNYCFSSAAKPGLLYLPRRSFKNGLGGSTTPPAQQAKNDDAARRTVLWALGLSNTLSAVDFEVNGFQVTPWDYVRVRRLIDEGEIIVTHEPSLGGNAQYDPAADALYLGNTAERSAPGLALIIHEATHAAFDAISNDINDAVSECIAYVAQMLFIMARDPKATAPQWDDPLDKTIFLPAWRYAKRIRAKQLKEPAPQYSTTASEDMLEIHKALLAHPTYQKQFGYSDANYDGLAGYNGIKGWVYNWAEE
jgi:hypothetical protein